MGHKTRSIKSTFSDVNPFLVYSTTSAGTLSSSSPSRLKGTVPLGALLTGLASEARPRGAPGGVAAGRSAAWGKVKRCMVSPRAAVPNLF